MDDAAEKSLWKLLLRSAEGEATSTSAIASVDRSPVPPAVDAQLLLSMETSSIDRFRAAVAANDADEPPKRLIDSCAMLFLMARANRLRFACVDCGVVGSDG